VVAAGIAIWVILLVAAGVFLAGGVLLLALAPVLAGRLATTASKPKLERRASGPDRMEKLIRSQLDERRRRSSFAVTLTRSGAVLVGVAVVALIAGGVLAFFGGS
jgi:hypothetical protein